MLKQLSFIQAERIYSVAFWQLMPETGFIMLAYFRNAYYSVVVFLSLVGLLVACEIYNTFIGQ